MQYPAGDRDLQAQVAGVTEPHFEAAGEKERQLCCAHAYGLHAPRQRGALERRKCAAN